MIDEPRAQQGKQRQHKIRYRPGKRRQRHALLRLLEIAHIHRHGLRPAEAEHQHTRKAHPVDVVQRVQAQPMLPLRGRVAERIGRKAVAGLVDRQA